ncbi:MAG: hypothetical protein ACP5GU_02155 [Thermoprotei archaeon]|jgi:hypothetical protein
MVIRNNEDEAIFRDAIKFIIEIIKKSGRTRTYHHLVPKIDFTNRMWYLELKSKTAYHHLFELKDEVSRLESVRRCLSLMFRKQLLCYIILMCF